MPASSFRSALLAVAALVALPASALDLSWSGFGTIGWAQSDRSWDFERSIDDAGTLDRDSVLGLQLDARLSAEWSATLQLKAAQAPDRDNAWAATPTWAFVAWRASDDWLVRVGRMRVPLYLYSEQIDVGATHDLARLPAEMYAIAPVNDFDGVYATKTWNLGDDELSLDAYAGTRKADQRFWSRDGGGFGWSRGEKYIETRLRGGGFTLTLYQPRGVWRASVYRVRWSPTDGSGILVKPVLVPDGLGPGLDYYKVHDAMPGPPVEFARTVTNDVYTIGMERRFADRWRVAAEYARNVQHDTELGSDTSGGYVALFREFGAVTPYVRYARLRTAERSMDWYRKLTGSRLPVEQLPPGYQGPASAINAAQRVIAETIVGADQRSLAVGASWSVGLGQKLKVEWQRTRIGEMSRLVDTPPEPATVHDTHVDVWSLNYNFVF